MLLDDIKKRADPVPRSNEREPVSFPSKSARTDSVSACCVENLQNQNEFRDPKATMALPDLPILGWLGLLFGSGVLYVSSPTLLAHTYLGTVPR